MFMTTSDTSVGMKQCCACGVDVAGQQRMKDSQGRYWCVPCGQADQRKKMMTATHLPCAACRKTFAKGKLNKDGEHFFCKACLKKRTAASRRTTGAATTAARATGHGASAVAAAPERRRLITMVAVLAMLILFAVLFNFDLL